MRKLFAAVLAVTLIAGAATPSFAEGEDYVAGPSSSPTWPQPDSRTPLADTSPKGGANFDMSRQGA
ncbi:hypothetical protein SAMN02745194_01801 [Roseomonas rosea]|uniref:Uncharacterized protein n=1 Tax=Muricoccus roseus TaxID=198092 RepID=A0A1M6GTV7_9PROT|nr:hypothetical protein [Roseomonas rosea]SHJ13347.1 hypothetical protein SAMN02745194_01801 [Roseomonas rosea]